MLSFIGHFLFLFCIDFLRKRFALDVAELHFPLELQLKLPDVDDIVSESKLKVPLDPISELLHRAFKLQLELLLGLEVVELIFFIY